MEPSRDTERPPDDGPLVESIATGYEVIRLGPEDWAWSVAGDVSEDGRVAGSAESANGDPAQEVEIFLWEAGSLVDLPDLRGAQYAWFAEDGNLILMLADGTHAIYRAETRTIEPYELDLPSVTPPPGFAEAEVNRTNQRGEAIGVLFPESHENVDGARGFVASDGDVVVLDPAPGGDTSVAWWINNAGQVVGGPARDVDDDGEWILDGRGFLYDLRTGRTTDLGTLPGFEGSMPWGINNAGEIVGEAWRWEANGDFVGLAFLYDPVTARIVDLNKLIPDESGWVLTVASDINDAGQIVGQGNVDGSDQAFLLNPRPRDLRT